MNMDYIFLSTLISMAFFRVLVLNDIACQWSKKLRERIVEFPPELHLNPQNLHLAFGIPKAHIKVHDESCQSRYSLNYLPGSAWTDGEGVEHDWVHMNALALSTREMGTGNREETLDNHWGAWNWHKVINLGKYFYVSFVIRVSFYCLGEHLRYKLLEAINNYTKQKAQHDELIESYTKDKLSQWDELFLKWEQDQTEASPYEGSEKSKLNISITHTLVCFY